MSYYYGGKPRFNAANSIPGQQINAQYIHLKDNVADIVTIYNNINSLLFQFDSLNNLATFGQLIPIIVNNASDATGPNMGAIAIAGGLSTGKKLYIADATDPANINANASFHSEGGGVFKQSLWVGGALHVGSIALSFTPKSVLFADTNGNIAQDNANFNYDSVATKLSVPHVASTDFTGALIGNSDTTTKLKTAVNIGGSSFDGSQSITPANATNATNTTNVNMIEDHATTSQEPIVWNSGTTGNQALKYTSNGAVAATIQPSTGNITAPKFIGPLNGNSDTSTKWAATIKIGNVNCDGSSDMTPQKIDVTTNSSDTADKILFAHDASGATRPLTGSATYDATTNKTNMNTSGTADGGTSGNAASVTVQNNTTDTNDQLLFANGTGSKTPQSVATIYGDLKNGNLGANNIWSLVSTFSFPWAYTSITNVSGQVYDIAGTTAHNMQSGDGIKIVNSINSIPSANGTYTISSITNSTTIRVNLGVSGMTTGSGSIYPASLEFDVSALSSGDYRLECRQFEVTVASNIRFQIYSGSWITTNTYSYFLINPTFNTASVQFNNSSATGNIPVTTAVTTAFALNLEIYKNVSSLNLNSYYFNMKGDFQAGDRGGILIGGWNTTTTQITQFKIYPDGASAYIQAGTFRLYKKSN